MASDDYDIDNYVAGLRALAAQFKAGELSKDQYQDAMAKLRHDTWAEFHADEIKASGRRTKLCNVCRTVRVPALVHACEVCD